MPFNCLVLFQDERSLDESCIHVQSAMPLMCLVPTSGRGRRVSEGPAHEPLIM